MQQESARTGLAMLLATAAGVTIGLQLLGSPDPAEWSRDPEGAALAVIRYAGLVVGYWITVTTSVYALTHERRSGPLAGRLTIPGIRRLVDTALATALTTSIALGQPALAGEPPPPAPVIFDISAEGVPVPLIRFDQPAEDQPVTPPSLAANPSPPPSTVTTTGTATTGTSPGTHIVEEGDHLWKIAASRVTGEAVDAYWRRLVEANRTTLRSGDPNLIYPGEVIALPPLEVNQ